MFFLSYWSVVFCISFFALFFAVRTPRLRRFILLAGCALFYAHFGGIVGVIPILLLGVASYICGLIGGRVAPTIGIALNVAALVGYKYLPFLTYSALSLISTELAESQSSAIASQLPELPPLGISFFVFEYCQYLIEVRRGGKPITSPATFALFGAFWPTVVAGPIKRYQQFLPEMEHGLRAASGQDVVVGMLRVSQGLVKKFIADYLTQLIDFWDNDFGSLSLEWRWLILGAIALRILFDFSGYSDIAIGYARMMGIRIPENFWWPYLATSPVDFWRRWHISLSSWIRDYVYIPLGGNRRGDVRRFANAVIAFVLIGLWHGAAWNFAIWGVYNGVGVALASPADKWMRTSRFLASHRAYRFGVYCVGWVVTMAFVSVGWLLFFYPVSTALTMAGQLFQQ